MAQDSGKPFPLGVTRHRSLLQLARDNAQSIGCDAGVKGGMPLELRHGALFEEIAHCGHELQNRRLIHHGQIFPRMMRLTKSISFSDERRPMAARSTEWSRTKP